MWINMIPGTVYRATHEERLLVAVVTVLCSAVAAL